MLSSTRPLGAIGDEVSIFARNAVDQKPIAGAQVTSTYDSGEAIPFGSGVTNGNGLCTLAVLGHWYYMNITVQANGYVALTQRILHTTRETLNFFLSPVPEGTVTYDIKLVAIDSLTHRLQNVKVTIGGVACITNGLGEVHFFLEKGSRTVAVEGTGLYWSGWPIKGAFTVTIVPWTGTIAVTKNATYTLSVEQQLIIGGNPPAPPPDQGLGASSWDWLIKYGPYVAAGAVALGAVGYFLASTSKVVSAVRGGGSSD